MKWFWGLAWGVACPAVWAQGTFVSAWDNDKFGFDGQDRGYTNGMELAVADASGTEAWGLGQQMYTPTSHQALPDPHDRPYVGWLYLGREYTQEQGRHLSTTRWTFGLVGPGAGAETTQDEVHHLLGVRRFQGWGHQLRNEPTLQWSHTRWRRSGPRAVGPLEVEWAGHADAQAGNLEVSGALGALVRVGVHLGPELPGARSGAYGWTGPWVATRPSDQWAAFAWVGLTGTGVAHDLTLDGSTFARSPSVPRRPWQAEWTTGATLLRGRWSVAFAWHRLSREFEGQAQTPRYGTLVIAKRF